MLHNPVAISSKDRRGPVRRAEGEFWDADIEARRLGKTHLDRDPSLERRKFVALLDQLAGYASERNWKDGLPVETLSNETAFRLEQIMRRLLNGETVEGFDAACAKGKRRSLDALGALEELALYVKAVQTWPAFLADADPIETARVAFGMNTRNQVTKALRELGNKQIEFGQNLTYLIELGDLDELREHVQLFKVRLAVAGKVWAASKTTKARDRYETDRRRN